MGSRVAITGILSVIAVPAALAGSLDAKWVEIANNTMGDAVPDYPLAVLANDPVLASTPARTFDLVVTTTNPIRWTSCDLQVDLNEAQAFYLSPTGSMRDAKPSTWQSQPANEFSTFLCVPTFQHLNALPGMLLGKAQYPVASGTGTAILSNSQINAAWGNIPPAPSGTATIARLTVLNGFSGGTEFNGRVGVSNNDLPAQAVTYSNCGYRMSPLSITLDADANEDGSVDTQDFNLLAGHFGQMGSLPVSSGNFNRDLIVNSLDLNVLAGSYGTHPAAAALGSIVPEPASLGMIMAFAMPSHRKRRREASPSRVNAGR